MLEKVLLKTFSFHMVNGSSHLGTILIPNLCHCMRMLNEEPMCNPSCFSIAHLTAPTREDLNPSLMKMETKRHFHFDDVGNPR